MSCITKLVNTSLESSNKNIGCKNWVTNSVLLYSLVMINQDSEPEQEMIFLGGILAMNWLTTFL